MRFKYLAILLLFISTLSVGAIYVETGKTGETVYSDMPFNQNSKPIVPPTPMSVSAGTVVPAPAVTSPLPGPGQSVATVDGKKPYTLFAISSPKDQENIQNQPNIFVDIVIEPALQAGDKIQVSVDGSVLKSAASTHFDLGLLERGIHQISAAIVDSNQKVLKQSSAITVYIHQANTTTAKRAAGN